MKLKDEEFKKAYQVIKSALPPTPLILNEWLSQKYGAEIYLKLENLQPVGSFKLRGALYKISKLNKKEKEQGVIAVSAGNHAQGVAWAAARNNTKAIIIMPVNSPLTKISNTERLGAEVILSGKNVDESFEYLKEYNKDKNHIVIHPFADEDVIYGQGSIAFELENQIDHCDFIFGSIGGGGLMTGLGHAYKRIMPQCQFVGSQPMGACSMIQSLNEGRVINSAEVNTIADGLKVKNPVEKMMKYLDEVLTDTVIVNDNQISQSVLELIEQARIISEGAGAINLAAFDGLYHQNPRRFKNKKIIILICGGNIDINLIDRIIEQGLISSARRMKIKIILDDVPGALNLLTTTILENNANVLQVEHRRDDPRVKLSQSIVEATLETKNKEHSLFVLEKLKEKFEIIW